jgi:hypothetical protein
MQQSLEAELILALETYNDFLERGEFQRSDSLLSTSDSRLTKMSVFSGFLVSTVEVLNIEPDNYGFGVTSG